MFRPALKSIPAPRSEIGDTPSSPPFTADQETLFARRFEENYDVQDTTYIAWLKINHPEKSLF